MSDLPLLEPVYQDEATGSSRPSHRRRWITAGTAGAVFVAAVATLGVLDWRRHHSGSTLSTPATIGTLRHDTAADATQTADYLRNALGADIALRSTTGAVYSDPADKTRVVLLFGGTGSFSSPGKELGTALGLLDDSSGSITGLHDVPSGPLGGATKCGTSNGDGGPMTACGWADNGSVAVALFPGRSVDESATLIRQVRSAVEHRK